MAPNKPNDREARQARERLRAYQARQSVHEKTVKRRRRDNILAATGLFVILVLAVGTQLLYFGAHPGKASASGTPTPSASGTPTPTPSGSGTPTPSASGTSTPTPAAAVACPPAADPSDTGKVPASSLSECRNWTGTLTINKIPLGIQLDGKQAPQAVASTVSLVKKGFYNGLSCHRLTNGGFYVLQCGDPNGDGSGGPGYSYGPIENAPADNVYPAGTLAMARQTDNAASNGSQFFIVYKTTTISSDTAGGYTVIGKITSGLDQLNAQVTSKGIAPGGSSANDGKPAVATKITSVTVK